MKFKDFLTEEELFEAAPGRMTKSKWRDALVLVQLSAQCVPLPRLISCI